MNSLKDHLIKVYSTLAEGILFTVFGACFPGVPWIFSVVLGVLFMLNAMGNNSILSFFVFSFCQGLIVADLCREISWEVQFITFVITMSIFLIFTATSFLTNKVHEFMLASLVGNMLTGLVLVSFFNWWYQSVLLVIGDVIIGILVFSMYLLVDTAKIVYEHEEGCNDHILHAVQVYVDLLNIWIRLLILVDSLKKDKKKIKNKK